MMTLCFSGSTLPERWHRRLLRSALQSRDPRKLRLLIAKGLDVNKPVSEVFWDTPLTYSVKAGFLEMVEQLCTAPECDVDLRNRNKHTALDEAFCCWMLGGMNREESKQDVGRRYRILRCLLATGAETLTVQFLDMLVFTVLSNPGTGGGVCVGKLVRAVCERGTEKVRSAVLSILSPYPGTSRLLWALIQCGASPTAYATRGTSTRGPYLPLDNAILLLRACNHPTLLRRIDCDTSAYIDSPAADWFTYKVVLKLLTLSGHKVQGRVMSHCYRNHADIYAWMARYCRSPQRLAHLCRVIVRRHLHPSVPVAVAMDKHMPATIKHCLLFEQLGDMHVKMIEN